MTDKLTEKQRRFVEAYLGEANGNATEAARLAGYSGTDDSLAVSASQLLRNTKVEAAIKERTDNDPLVLSRQQRLEYLTKLITNQEYEYTTNKDGEIITRPAATRDKLKALDILNKMGGDYIENKNIKVSGGLELSDLDELARFYRDDNTDST